MTPYKIEMERRILNYKKLKEARKKAHRIRNKVLNQSIRDSVKSCNQSLKEIIP